jgi:hypothetical protein
MPEGQLKLVVNDPTQNATDGTLASQVLQTYPVNVIINTGEANHKLFKAAIRCDSGMQTVGPWEITFVGDTATKWSIADGVAYSTEADAEYATYNASLTSSTVVTDKNHVVWLKAETDGTETAQVDTSVQVRVWGRVVPAGGA